MGVPETRLPKKQPNTLYPCPFSKGYGIPVKLAWSLLSIFFLYRFILTTLFVALYHSRTGPSLLGSYDALLYTQITLGYNLFTLLTGLFLYKRWLGYTTQAQVTVFTDIIFLTLVMHACGGVASGLGVLLAVSIANAGLLIGGRCALLFAALASLALLTEQVYAGMIHAFPQTSFTYAGMLGASFFTIAYLSYVLAKRTEQSEQLASEKQNTILSLEELNQYIIQHLQSGIIICNPEQEITMCNNSALHLLRYSTNSLPPDHIDAISTDLSACFKKWLADIHQDSGIIHQDQDNDIYVRFSWLKTHLETFHMIILEDAALYNQRLQQSKLASLGRLTASIAHEIRNPLAAISHAGQLLSETPELSEQDKHLTSIIQKHCERVNKIIEDILQLSRRRPSNREKIDLIPWIQQFLNDFMQNHQCQPECLKLIVATEPVHVLIDVGHLKQILDNLCNNALKYGNSHEAPIILKLVMHNHRPCLKLIDNADPISPDIAQHLFEPFFTTSTTGTGLGLYISRELAELNQAKLSYALEDQKNCFILCLPDANESLIEI
jgi:two-component system sensor histidine kinase PilS (NtrC family)